MCLWARTPYCYATRRFAAALKVIVPFNFRTSSTFTITKRNAGIKFCESDVKVTIHKIIRRIWSGCVVDRQGWCWSVNDWPCSSVSASLVLQLPFTAATSITYTSIAFITLIHLDVLCVVFSQAKDKETTSIDGDCSRFRLFWRINLDSQQVYVLSVIVTIRKVCNA